MLVSRDRKNLTDEQLFREFCSVGAEAAYQELFDRYYTPLTIYANHFLNDVDSSSDIVQSLFVSLYERRDSLSIGSVKSFLYGSVRNACLNVLKHEKVKREYDADFLSTASEFDSGSADILIQESEAMAKVASAMSQLPDQCARIFTMSRFDGLTNQQIADDLAISKRTVETQISNALKVLRRLLLSADSVVGMLLIIVLQ